MFGLRVFGLGGQGGCERRIEAFVKIQKKIFFFFGGGGSGWGVRVDVIEELTFLGKFTKKSGGGEGVREWGSGWGSGWGGGGQGGCVRNVGGRG